MMEKNVSSMAGFRLFFEKISNFETPTNSHWLLTIKSYQYPEIQGLKRNYYVINSHDIKIEVTIVIFGSILPRK